MNEPDPITSDLFQGTENALPETEGRAVSTGRQKRWRDGNRQGAIHVLAVREAPDTEGLYHVQAQLVTVRERHLQVDRVKSQEDAARAFAPNRMTVRFGYTLRLHLDLTEKVSDIHCR